MDKLACLDAMGIDVWVRREQPSLPAKAIIEIVNEESAGATTTEEADPVVAINPSKQNDVGALDWEQLEQRVLACTLCELHKTRTQAVFGVGNKDADWMIIGEAPGAEEDRHGEPFVGRAGQLLNAMLEAVGLKREEVFIANVLKCRPPNNRDPRAEEVASCEPYLKRQIELVQPKIILCVGRIAAQNLLKTDMPIGRMRGRKHVYEPLNIPVIVTYHPAYLLRSPTEKRKSWQDLLLARSLMESAG